MNSLISNPSHETHLQAYHHVIHCRHDRIAPKKRKNPACIIGYFEIIRYLCLANGGLAQLARALAWHARGHEFESRILHFDARAAHRVARFVTPPSRIERATSQSPSFPDSPRPPNESDRPERKKLRHRGIQLCFILLFLPEDNAAARTDGADDTVVRRRREVRTASAPCEHRIISS